MYGMKITYFNTLYGKNTEINVFGSIYFDQAGAHFSSGGLKRCIEAKYIVKIEPISD